MIIIFQLHLRLNTDQFMEKKNPSMSARVARIANVSDDSNLKISSSKQMLQILPIELAQVKAGNKSENLLNAMTQILYSLYRAKEITKKAYNNIMNLIKL